MTYNDSCLYIIEMLQKKYKKTFKTQKHKPCYNYKLEMSQLLWLQRNGSRRMGHNKQTDLSIFLVKGHVK